MAYEAKITLRIKKTAIMIYRDCPSAVFVLSEKRKCRSRRALRIRVNTSMYRTKGHSQPQKNLPKTTDATATMPKTIASFSKPVVE
jgi:hypothetical protein